MAGMRPKNTPTASTIQSESVRYVKLLVWYMADKLGPKAAARKTVKPTTGTIHTIIITALIIVSMSQTLTQ